MKEMLSVLLSLPDDVVRNRILSMLPLKSILLLDSSICESKSRLVFLRQLDTLFVPVHSTKGKEITTSALFWLQKRNVYVGACALAINTAPEDILGALPVLRHVRELHTRYVHPNLRLEVLLTAIDSLTSCTFGEVEGGEGNYHFITDSTIELLASRHPHLRKFEMWKCNAFGDKALQSFAQHCPEITGMVLYNCDEFTSEGVADLCKGCRHLQYLYFYQCSNLTDVALQAMGAYCPDLQILTTSQCENITDTGIIVLAQGCPKLGSLGVEFTQLTDAGLNYLADSCPLLYDFKVRGCEVSDDSLIHFFSKHPLLTEFDFAAKGGEFAGHLVCKSAPYRTRMITLHLGNCNIDDDAVEAVAEHCSNLRVLDLSVCVSLTDRALIALSRGCPFLQNLNLTFCMRVGDVGVIALVRGCTTLEILNLSFNPILTDAAFVSIGEFAQNLLDLDASGCEELTSVGINALQNCASLRRLTARDCPKLVFGNNSNV